MNQPNTVSTTVTIKNTRQKNILGIKVCWFRTEYGDLQSLCSI